MSKTAREVTDEELKRIEEELIRIYSRAEKELGEKAESYFKKFSEKDKEKKQLLDAGKITETEYKKWRVGQMMTGKHWTDMRDQMAERLTKADKEAMEYLNGRLPEVYSLNYNEVASGISDELKGISFELVDPHTVKNLATSDETLLPYKVVDGQKAERWHTKTVNAEVMQGILQGESIPKLAKRLEQNVGMKAAGSAVRNARTTVTSAENKGRMDMLHYAKEKGVICHKIWRSSNDGLTRDAHLPGDFASLEVEIDEPFENSLGEIMYPGDPSADPANVYNCRCSLIYKVVGFGEEVI